MLFIVCRLRFSLSPAQLCLLHNFCLNFSVFASFGGRLNNIVAAARMCDEICVFLNRPVSVRFSPPPWCPQILLRQEHDDQSNWPSLRVPIQYRRTNDRL